MKQTQKTECPRCKSEVWDIPVEREYRRDLWDIEWNLWLLQWTEVRLVFLMFVDHMDYSDTRCEHLPCFCQWTLPLLAINEGARGKKSLQLWIIRLITRFGKEWTVKLWRAACSNIWHFMFCCVPFPPPPSFSFTWSFHERVTRAPGLWISSTYYISSIPDILYFYICKATVWGQTKTPF